MASATLVPVRSLQKSWKLWPTSPNQLKLWPELISARWVTSRVKPFSDWIMSTWTALLMFAFLVEILLENLLRIKGSDFSIHELVLTLFIISWIDLIHNTRYLCMRLKTDVTWFLRGQASDKIILPIQEIMVEFVYSRQQLNENLFP